jgi:hypothetical protein
MSNKSSSSRLKGVTNKKKLKGVIRGPCHASRAKQKAKIFFWVTFPSLYMAKTMGGPN